MISLGHQDPFKYTLRQAVAFAEVGMKRKNEDLASQFIIMQNAMHADEKGAKKLKERLLNGTV